MVLALVGDSTMTRSNLRPPVAGTEPVSPTAVVLGRRMGAGATAVAGAFRGRFGAGVFAAVVFFLGTESTPMGRLQLRGNGCEAACGVDCGCLAPRTRYNRCLGAGPRDTFTTR